MLTIKLPLEKSRPRWAPGTGVSISRLIKCLLVYPRGFSTAPLILPCYPPPCSLAPAVFPLKLSRREWIFIDQQVAFSPYTPTYHLFFLPSLFARSLPRFLRSRGSIDPFFFPRKFNGSVPFSESRVTKLNSLVAEQGSIVSRYHSLC